MSERTHYFNRSLQQETNSLWFFDALFLDVPFEDVRGDKAFQALGSDYRFLREGQEPVLVEAKFEDYASGNMSLEGISVDRPTVKPGWMATSRAAWLVSFMKPSGDVVAVPLAALRAWYFQNYARFRVTAVNNYDPRTRKPRYTTYTTLAPIRVVLDEVPGAMRLDMREVDNTLRFAQPSMFSRDSRYLATTPAELLDQIMAGQPHSEPEFIQNAAEWLNELQILSVKRKAA